jgi:hypothetical protein
MDGWMEKAWWRGVAHGWVSCLWGYGRLRCARRPPPQTPQGAMLDCDMIKHVLDYVPVMLSVDLSPGVFYG